ncbi:MAG: amidohydrolase 2 [Actinomycetia bacterium]|nr:amidohydrolase 2 [Actinomycetes bacterium]
MTAAQLIIDADSHVTEPRDVWTSRVPAKFRDDVPHVERTEGVDTWYLQGERLGTMGVSAPAGWPEHPPEYPPTLEDTLPAASEAKERLRYMDEAGIWAQVLYPNVGGFGSEHFLALQDAELKLACVTAYNDFLLEWCSADPKRLLPVLATPFWDIDQTVAEIERGIDAGARGVLFTGEPQRYGLPYLGDHHWDPMWSVAQEAGLPIHFHIGSAGELPEIFTPERIEAHGHPGTQAFVATDLFLKNGVQCADLITCGMLPRFPDLKFVSVESGMGWVPFMLEAADYSWKNALPGRKSPPGLLPSELFAQHVFVTYWFEQIAPNYLLDVIPIDNILFETDFPHTTCLYGNIDETIAHGLGHVSDEVRQKILWGNSARLYGIEGPPS